MKKLLLLLFLSLASATYSVAQGLNQAIPSLQFTAPQSTLEPLSDGGWILTVNEDAGINDAHQTGRIIRLDANGLVLWEKVLGNKIQTAHITSFNALQDGRLLVCWNRLGCETFPVLNFTMFDANGLILWTHEYQRLETGLTNQFTLYNMVTQVDEHIFWVTGFDAGHKRAQFDLNDGHITRLAEATAYSMVFNNPANEKELIWVKQELGIVDFYEKDQFKHRISLFAGGSQGQVSNMVKVNLDYPNLTFRDWNNTILLTDWDGNVRKILPAGPILDIAVTDHKIAVLTNDNASTNDGVVIYSGDQLQNRSDWQSFDNQPATLSSVSMSWVGDQLQLCLAAQTGKIETVDNFYSYFDFNNSNYTTRLVTFDPESGMMSTVNTADAGVSAVSCSDRSWGYLVGISDSLIETVGFTGYAKFFDVWVRVKNYGTEVLESVVLNAQYGLIDKFCNADSALHRRYDGLHLQPGAEVELLIGEALAINKGVGDYGDTRRLCVWTTYPNDKSDRNVTNDAACTEREIKRFPLPNTFRIFPNPVRDELYISLPVSNLYGAGYAIHNITGQLMSKGIVENEAGYYVIATALLQPGVYILQIGDQVVKFVKI